MPSSAPDRRWLSFSLRRMLIAFALFGGILSLGRWWYVRIYRQDSVAWELLQLNCHVEFDSLHDRYVFFDSRRKSADDVQLWKQFQTEIGRVANAVSVSVPCESDETAERVNELIRKLPSVRHLKFHTLHFAKPNAALSAAEGRHTAIILRDLPITEVSFGGEQQNTEAAAAVARLPHLTTFSGPAMSLSAEELRAIVDKESLRSIFLGPGSLSAEAFELLVGAEHLESLRLINPSTENIHLLAKRRDWETHIKFEHATDEDLGAIANLPSLKILNLWNCSVTDEGVAALSQAQSLETLYLAYLSVTDRSLESLVGLSRLKELNCVGSDITVNGVIFWAKRRPNVLLRASYELNRARFYDEAPGGRVVFDRTPKGNLEDKANREAKEATDRMRRSATETDAH